MKLAYWPENEDERATRELAHGMYLSVSYIRMLLDDDSTRGTKDTGPTRILGYGNVERHLVGQRGAIDRSYKHEVIKSQPTKTLGQKSEPAQPRSMPQLPLF